MRPDQEEQVRRMREEWRVRVFPSPYIVDWLLDVRDNLTRLRDVGFVAASCSWCSVARPLAEEARCPVCDCFVGRSGRRRFQRPAILGVTVPDEGFSPAQWDELEDRATEQMLESLVSRLPRGPEN